MLSREDLETFRDNHLKARDRLIANVNVCQGAIDCVNSLLVQWDKKPDGMDEV